MTQTETIPIIKQKKDLEGLTSDSPVAILGEIDASYEGKHDFIMPAIFVGKTEEDYFQIVVEVFGNEINFHKEIYRLNNQDDYAVQEEGKEIVLEKGSEEHKKYSELFDRYFPHED